ncbi:hypothetical protein BV898_18744 [Hypsibius exemplaris]|uniref:Uncharacterized protein n=1 Tax=Hypsibius exemplaris TaxID=2072580 RepID=A0A9X6RP48_HYPEX|nr:hypothetical protein BV898_18744 [Hypsibius exemplaris]
MKRLAISSGILILLLHLNCLESRSDLGGHSEAFFKADRSQLAFPGRIFSRRTVGIWHSQGGISNEEERSLRRYRSRGRVVVPEVPEAACAPDAHADAEKQQKIIPNLS